MPEHRFISVLEKDIVISSVEGIMNSERRKRERDETLAFAENRNLRKIIIDTSKQISSEESYVDLFNFSSTLRKRVQGFQIAIVTKPEDTAIQYITNTAHVKKLNIKIFHSIAEAISWLTSS